LDLRDGGLLHPEQAAVFAKMISPELVPPGFSSEGQRMRVSRRWAAAVIVSILALSNRALAAIDPPAIVIADFESADYAGWIVTGTAFGAGPADATLPNQNIVDGFQGRYVSSYHGTDSSQGTLTSPRFAIERDAITMLVGGGNHPNATCANLIVEGKVVRTMTGSNSEHLLASTWDTRDLRGKQAQIQIVDGESGGWGHIIVDQIVQTDHPAVPPIVTSPAYHETYRPQFHFTSKTNWINDPNGCVFHDGEYHLFFQHNPSGNEWGNMTWGHAVSPDLIHWTQIADALKPDGLGTMFSGSAVVDTKNTSGFGKGGQPPLVAMYTAAGGTNAESKGKPFTQCIAYSNDKGRTWTKYAKNPVIGHIVHENRDPKLIWHEPTQRWIVALYLDGDRFALFASSDLKEWTKLQELSIPGTSECPDFFPLPLDGDASKSKWVLTAADAGYLVGDFDGKMFVTDGKTSRIEAGRNNYAVQTFSDVPDGRRIQIGWLRDGKFPHMPFKGQMSFPATLELRTTPEGPRLFRNPIREIESIQDQPKTWSNVELKTGENPLADLKGDLFRIKTVIRPDQAKSVGFVIRGQRVEYNVGDRKLSALGDAQVDLIDGKLMLEILVDRTTIETFANDGIRAFSSCFLPTDYDKPSLAIFSDGGTATIESLTVWPLKSAWPDAGQAKPAH
jgi:sucrose-6-phosphate hydrolase SacC (GH32 family)